MILNIQVTIPDGDDDEDRIFLNDVGAPAMKGMALGDFVESFELESASIVRVEDVHSFYDPVKVQDLICKFIHAAQNEIAKGLEKKDYVEVAANDALRAAGETILEIIMYGDVEVTE